MSGYSALLYLEWRTLLAQLRLLLRARGRLVIWALVLAYFAFIVSRGRAGMPHLPDAAALYAVALWLLSLGLASIGGRRCLLARPADLALVVPSAIPPDRIVVWTLARQALSQLRLLVVVAVFWVPQMAASGGVGWGTLLYAVGLSLIAAMALRYVLLDLGRWGSLARWLLLAAFAALALLTALALLGDGLAGVSQLATSIWPLSLALQALLGQGLALLAFGLAAVLLVAAMVALAPRIVRLGVDWGLLPLLARTRGAGRYSAAALRQERLTARVGRRALRRRDWPGRGDLALCGVELARLYRTLWPRTASLIALLWVFAGVAGALAAERGVPWQIVPAFVAYVMVLSGAAVSSVQLGTVLATPLWSQTPGALGRKLLAWFLPGALTGGVGWTGVAVGWLLGAHQTLLALWSLPLGLALMLMVRGIGLVGWSFLPNAVDQRVVAVWLRLLLTVVAAALAGACGVAGYALGGVGPAVAVAALSALGEAYLCLRLAALRIGRMDFVRPSEGRA